MVVAVAAQVVAQVPPLVPADTARPEFFALRKETVMIDAILLGERLPLLSGNQPVPVR